MDVIKGIYDLGALPGICMVKFGNEATVQSGLLRFILTVQIDLDKQGKVLYRGSSLPSVALPSAEVSNVPRPYHIIGTDYGITHRVN